MYASIGQYGKIIQLSSHPVVIEGARLLWVGNNINGAAHYIDGDDQPIPIPAKPSPAHTFDWATHQWTDSRTLAQHQDAKWEEIKAAREAAFNAPLITPHGTFDSGVRDRANITDAVLMAQTLAAAGQTVAIDFTRADNTAATLNASQMTEVGLYLGAKIQAAYATARSLRASIYSAGTITAVQALSWPS